MEVMQTLLRDHGQTAHPDPQAHLVLAFGSTAIIREPDTYERLHAAYPAATLIGCSTAGEILGTEVHDDSLCVTSVRFERTTVRLACTPVQSAQDSRAAGARLAAELHDGQLAHVFVISDGLGVNGTDLVEGLREVLPPGVAITGGLAGDGARFEETWVIANRPAARGIVAALGFYGPALRVGFGSLGGWDPFGPDRIITAAEGNVLYELDNQSALHLYKRYLGPNANGLPATGLLFPLKIKTSADDAGRVRTILGVDEAKQSMTFAGDMPVGAHAQLMRANFDRLIDGAIGAAEVSLHPLGDQVAQLAILISCVGRKLVLKQRIEEEVEGVRDVLGDRPILTGFYSYGEISPHTPNARCELHNQTMTITTFAEV
jgi:hypothetical protein